MDYQYAQGSPDQMSSMPPGGGYGQGQVPYGGQPAAYGAPAPYGAPPQQQQQQQTVVIVNQQPGSVAPPGQQQNIREWNHGLCSCFDDCCTCAFAYFCCCCFMCQLEERMDECCCGTMWCGQTFLVAMRTKLRAQYGIRGSVCKDICAVACCPFCVAVQMAQELKTFGRW